MWKHVLAAAILSCGCGSVSTRSADAAIDADLTAPDADLTAPDADLTAPDADPTAPDANPAAPDANPSAADGGTAPTVCGGFAGIPCDSMHFCDWTPDSCGAA